MGQKKKKGGSATAQKKRQQKAKKKRQRRKKKKVGGTTQPCPKVRMAELVEVTDQAGGGQTTAPAQGRDRQFVNLDPAPGHPEFGRVIKLKARLQWASGNPKRSLAGQKIYWYYKPWPTNRAGLTGQLPEGFDSPGGPKQKTTPVDAQGWTPVVEFHLSKYGGDKFDIYATEDSAFQGGLSSGTYTVWRKLFYELDCMKRPPAQLAAPVAAGGAAYPPTYADRADKVGLARELGQDKAFIEVEQTGTDDSPAHQRILTIAEVGGWASGVRNGTGQPRYFHLVLVDTIADDPANKRTTVRLNNTDTITLDGSKFSLDPRDWFVSATFKED